MKYRRVSILGCLVVVLLCMTACVTQKKLYTMGKQQMELGMYPEATETLINALAKKKSNVEVQLTLRNCAVIVFEQKTDQIGESYQSRQLQSVIEYYKQLKNLQSRLNEIGIIIDIPVRATTLFNQTKETVNEELYFQAQKALQNRDFGNAARLFREILALDRNYKDASAGLTIAVNQPIFEQANELFDKNKFRTAYPIFKRIPTYKNAKEMIDLCVERGRAKYLFVPTELNNLTYFNYLGQRFKENRTSPFFTPIMYQDYLTSLPQYGIKHRDLIIYSPATKALHDIGNFSAIVQINTLKTQVTKAEISRKKQKGFHEKVEEIKREDGTKERIVSYTKVYYYIVQTTRPQEVISEIYLRMIHPKDGSLIFGKNYIRSKKQDLCYIEYEGNVKSLVAGDWTVLNLPLIASKDKVYDSNHASNKFIRQCYNAPRALPDANKWSIDQQTEIAKELVSEIVKTSLED